MSKQNPRTIAARTVTDLHIRLCGPVSCRAYSIGPVAARLGNTTIVVEDRRAALSLAAAAIWFEDAADHLGPTFAGRIRNERPGEGIVSLVPWTGTQAIADPHITPAYRVADGCGTASLTIGHVRITACDRDAATVIADALASAYDDATEVFKRLRPLAAMREFTEARRAVKIARRPVSVR